MKGRVQRKKEKYRSSERSQCRISNGRHDDRAAKSQKRTTRQLQMGCMRTHLVLIERAFSRGDGRVGRLEYLQREKLDASVGEGIRGVSTYSKMRGSIGRKGCQNEMMHWMQGGFGNEKKGCFTDHAIKLRRRRS